MLDKVETDGSCEVRGGVRTMISPAAVHDSATKATLTPDPHPGAAPEEGPEASTPGRDPAIPDPFDDAEALEVRDRGCRFPGCESRFTEGHHVVHWADGGETSLGNTLLLCGLSRIRDKPHYPDSRIILTTVQGSF